MLCNRSYYLRCMCVVRSVRQCICVCSFAHRRIHAPSLRTPPPDTEFVQNLLPKIEWGALREASKALGMDELPEEVRT